MSMTTHGAIIIGLILYVVLTTMVSFFMMARVRKPADYLVAGRGLPVWALIGTIIGTCIGTGVIIGGSGVAYKHGWAGSAYPIGLGLGTLITGLCFSGMRRYRFMTLSEEIACYYERNRFIVEFSNITLFASQLCWLTVQIMGGATVLWAVTGLSPKLCIVLAGFAKAAISIPGGLKAVVYTDVLQTVILFFGFGFLMYSVLGEVGGLSGLRQQVPPNYFSFLGIESFESRNGGAHYGLWYVLSLIVVLTLNPIADPGRRLTIYSAHSEGSAKWSMVASGITVILFSIVIGITGMYTFHKNPNLASQDETLPWLVMKQLPAWLAGFVVVAVVSGMSSAANGNAAAAGTFFVRHIYPLATGRFPERPVLVARWALVFGFLASTGLALCMRNIVDFVRTFLPLTMTGLAVIILLGRFWKRSTWQGALAALLVTPAVTLGLRFFPVKSLPADPVIPATIIGIIAHVVVSLLTPPARLSFQEVADVMTRERSQIEHEPHGTVTTAPEPAAIKANLPL